MKVHPAFHVLPPSGRVVPLVLDSPHSGSEYPEDFGHTIARATLRRAEDAYIDELYASAPAHGAMLIAARFPRSYIDANRSMLDIDTQLLDAPWPGPAQAGRKTHLGIGLVWRLVDTGEPIYSRRLSVEEVKRRITDYHQPYQRAVKDALDAAHAHFGAVWHLNCHSMQSVSGSISEEGPGKLRPDFVLGDRDGTTCAPEFTRFVEEFLRGLGYSVAINNPYKGVELVRAFSDPPGNRHSLQVEVNRKLYMDERTLERSAGFDGLRSSLDRLVKAVAAFAAERGSHACDAGHDHRHDHDHHGHDHSHGHHSHSHKH